MVSCIAYQLDYTNPPDNGLSQYNGNIAAISWKSEKFPDYKKYQFTYDKANRLLTTQYNISQRYNVITGNYDKNGNIGGISRIGEQSPGTYGPIDQLFFDYNGNQLQKVNDVDDGDYQNNGFSDNGSFESIEYFYDPN